MHKNINTINKDFHIFTSLLSVISSTRDLEKTDHENILTLFAAPVMRMDWLVTAWVVDLFCVG